MTSRTLRASVKLQFIEFWSFGAADGDRTRNTRNGSPMLYQLNYCGVCCFVEVTVWRIRCSVWSTSCGE